MPCCHVTFDEKQRPPLDKGGLQGGFWEPMKPPLDLCLVSHTIFKRLSILRDKLTRAYDDSTTGRTL